MPPPVFIAPEDIGESNLLSLIETPLKALGRKGHNVIPPNIIISTKNNVVKLDWINGLSGPNGEVSMTGDTILGFGNSSWSSSTAFGFFGYNDQSQILCMPDPNTAVNCEFGAGYSARVSILYIFSDASGTGGPQTFDVDLKFPGPSASAFVPFGYPEPDWNTLQAVGSAHNGEIITPVNTTFSFQGINKIDVQNRQIWMNAMGPVYGGFAVYPKDMKACFCVCPALLPGVMGFHNQLGGGLISPATTFIVNKPINGTANDDDWNQKLSSAIDLPMFPFPIYFRPGPGPRQVTTLVPVLTPTEDGLIHPLRVIPYNYATDSGQVIIYWPAYRPSQLPKANFHPADYNLWQIT